MVDWADDNVGASHKNKKNTLRQDSAAVERSRLCFMTGGRARGTFRAFSSLFVVVVVGQICLLGCQDEEKVAGVTKKKKKEGSCPFFLN